ncbi:MAG: hypothetical protein SPJ62_12850 [Inconstantimicrobium porci]|uniref:hypothetical protein n=1 Tax=Inconstantimicrobium porci TaxID=2652291 RepID=UPI0012B39B80|nr:hypothetical protein [Inconstantimicrobium porci]MDD6771299.1 hypothetical protein [Inconstantimicrobium porci]MDY5912861.1 hypothetical protein [Inconstantimicrobium porci]
MYNIKNNQKFDFNKDEIKQCIGRMVEKIMADYGYTPDKDMELKDTIFFKNAMKYK